ncbi:M24 family metallopeptidase [Sphingomonas sp. MAH-20]|uniref:M24 family metallopeptidase n=1 Tax=Sphingomonas horti TaxID=2682842 RepID=A0A6I4J2Q1_9SPHN|nr:MULTISPECIES: Xaa-Pro peptidase family protein [Sphingomonas]MBA2919483.1 aminopeptidase P family protein [Sphingomonas sp. CGMCC 1.13658]MVO78363.1 M24 family metallopeptidase [Sphingomonas horti]
MNRRQLLQTAGLLGLSTLLPSMAFAAEIDTSDLKNMTGDIVPIGREERSARLARAQELMRRNGLSAVVIEPGSSLIYFTGVRWWRSERLTAAVLPVSGEPLIVTPFFERPSVQETLGIPAEIRVWQEDESPTAVIAKWLKERRLDRGPIGIEETVRFFASDGLGALLSGVRLVSANPVVRGCRMHKTAAEIALMQKANDITIAAIRWTAPRIREGMTRDQVAAMIVAATQALGGSADGALVLLGEAAAYPHGSGKPQFVREGEVVLIDCGCTVDGYASDISRTLVFGKVPADVRRVFDTVAEGQRVAMRAARLGTPAGKVDDAVRAFYEREGYGPGYKLPGLSHRTGHGIGMDGHEPVNLVHGETTPLAVGMCFSNEPGLYLPGKFGVRLEDCFHMTPAGPKFFSEPPSSIDQPV